MTNRSRLTVALHGFAFVFLFGFGYTQTAEAADSGKDLLTGRYSREFLLEKMLPRDQWRPFPKANDRAAWEALQEHPLNQRRRDYIVGRAEGLLGKPWPALPATLYMEYVRNGNRSRYQDPYFDRRENLAILAIAECMEYRGRFLDEIANGIWAICEESTWCVPAHASRYKRDVLQRPDIESLDLFACETGMLLSMTHYLLEKELDGVSLALCDRIRREVDRRIITPFHSDNFARRGWLDGHNNWSPWCASNVMGAALYLEKDRERLADVVLRTMEVVDRFVNGYGVDGGCDEGPGYWGVAAGAMVIHLELLYSRTDGAVSIYDNPKIAAMGRFITYAHLDGPWFANFADADPRSRVHPGKVYRYGDRIGSEAMKNLALIAMREWDPAAPVNPPLRTTGVNRAVLGMLMELFWIPPDARPGRLEKETQVWLPDVQQLYVRESSAPGKGLVLAAKGGHNAESHNHNDLGHFIVCLDGQPGIIDIGRESYTRQTFSSRRYELWFTRGSGHNAPVVNGVEQQPGSQYRATDLRYEERADGPYLSMNLENAYPKEAGLKSLRREFELYRGDRPRIVVRDSFELAAPSAEYTITMYSLPEAKLVKPGLISIAASRRPLLLEYDASMFEVKLEPVPIEDEKLQLGWGERIHRVVFKLQNAVASGKYEFRLCAQ